MNPPTEPEQSDEEPTNLCSSTHAVEMKTVETEQEEEEEVLLEEDQEVQGITEAVEELAKNNSLSEELVEVVVREEKSPQLASRSLPAEVSSMKVSPMPETLVMEQEQEEHCEKTENATSSSLAASDLVEKEKEEEVAVQETHIMEVDTVKEVEKEEKVA